MTTKEEISRWFDIGVQKNATYMIVVCDTFDWEDYPVYITQEQNVHDIYKMYNNENMQKVMEVYNLNMDKEFQLNQQRAFNF